MEWQPMSTRPEEGEFYAYDPVSGKQDVCHASVDCKYKMEYPDDFPFGKYVVVSRRPSCSAVQQDGEYGPDEDEFQGDRATLWMPLFPPPEDTTK